MTAAASPPPNPDLMLCIICMTMKPVRKNGGEHVIAKSMGGSLVIDRVCVDCDNRLGTKADAGLINFATVHQRRVELELKGHSGELPEKDKHLIGKALYDVDDARHRLRWKRDENTGEAVARTEPYVEFEIQRYDDGMLIQPAAVYIDPVDIDKAPALARRALKNEGITDEVAIERIAAEFAASLETTVEQKNFVMTVQVNPDAHRDGILKIVYELAWYWLGESWLYDPVAIAMRESLNGNPQHGIRGKLYDDPNVGGIALEGDQRLLHVAYVFEVAGTLQLWIRLFDIMTACFVISDSPKNYYLGEKNVIVMHTVERQHDEVKLGVMAPGAVMWTHDSEKPNFS